MSNYFQHLAMRALGQVRSSDAQPAVRSRFEPESPRRSFPDIAVGNWDPGTAETPATAVPSDPSVETNAAPTGRAASSRLPISAPITSADPAARASQDTVRAADSPSADFSAPTVSHEPARLEMTEGTQAAAHTTYENAEPTVPREPRPTGLPEDLSAPVPSVVAKVGEAGTQHRRSADEARADLEASPDAAPDVKTSEPAAAPAKKSLKAALDGFGGAEDTAPSHEGAESDSSALRGPLGRESEAARKDLLGTGREVVRDTPSSARRESEAEEGREGQKTQTPSAKDAAEPILREKTVAASLSSPPASPAATQQPSQSAEESRRPAAVPAPVSVVPSASAPSPVLPAPQVHIRIGRIEVRAPAAKPAAMPAPVVPARTPSVALSDYLKQTRGRG